MGLLDKKISIARVWSKGEESSLEIWRTGGLENQERKQQQIRGYNKETTIDGGSIGKRLNGVDGQDGERRNGLNRWGRNSR